MREPSHVLAATSWFWAIAQGQTPSQAQPTAPVNVAPEAVNSFLLIPALILVVLMGATYLTGFASSKQVHRGAKLAWFWPGQFPKYGDKWFILLLAAFFWTLVFLLLSVCLVQWTHADLEKPGIVFLIAGVVFTVASVLNTIAILKQKMRHIEDFVQFFYELENNRVAIESRNKRTHFPVEPTERLYLLDYTPCVGEISERKITEPIVAVLHSFVDMPYCEGHFVFLASRRFVGDERGDLERFYRRFFLTDDETQRHADQADEEISKLDAGRFATWRSRRIHSEHHFVTVDKAVSYYVRPEPNGKRNELSGEVTEDIARVRYTQEVIEDYVAEAVTPDRVWQDDRLCLIFQVGQENIETIEIYYGSERTDLSSDSLKDKQPADPISVPGGKVSAGQVYECSNLRPEHSWLRLRLKKKGRAFDADQNQRKEPRPLYSQFSYIMPIPEKRVLPIAPKQLNHHTQPGRIVQQTSAGARRRTKALKVRDIAAGSVVYLRGVIEFTNICHHNCLYCGMRAQNDTLPRFVMEAEEILACARKARNDSIKTIMIQAADHLNYNVSPLCDVVRTISKELGQTVLLCLGDRPISHYELLREAGAVQAIVKFETSNEEVYRYVRPHCKLQNRLALIRSLANMGYQVSTGFILGLPRTSKEDTKRDLELVSTLLSQISLFAASVSPFIPNDQSPLANERMPTLESVLDCIAQLRILGPKLRIPAVSALNLLATREGRKEPGQLLGLQAGANVLTINCTPPAPRQNYVIYTSNRSIVELEHARRIAAEARLSVA